MDHSKDADFALAAEPSYRARLGLGARAQHHSSSHVSTPGPIVEEWRLDLVRLSHWTRKGWKWIIVLSVAGAIAGFSYGILAPQRFTASTDILVDPSKLQIVTDDIYAQSAARDSQLLDVESKLRILTSGNVLARVVDDLDLQNDPEFLEGGGMSGIDPELLALRNLGEHIRARREERSFVVTVSVWSAHAQKSVDISNALVAAFLTELSSAEADGAGRTATSLMDRLDELRASVNEAEERVEIFRRRHGLQSSEGQLVSARSMTVLTGQLQEAQQRQFQAESRYRDLVNGRAVAEAATDAQQSSTMTALRSQLATARQQYDAQARLLGPRHPTLTSLRLQVSSLEGQVQQETQRLVEAAKSEMDQAMSVHASLAEQSENVRSAVSTDNEAEVQLRELERDARSKATIYEAYLSRAREVTERQQLDTSNIRVISPSTLPLERSWPPRNVVLTLIGGASGLAAGFVLAMTLGLVGDFRRPKLR